jgi:hypothetical protein
MPKAKRTTKVQLRKKRQNFTKFLSVFKEETELHATKANKEIAESIVKEVRDVIEEQAYKWKPLSEEYLERKIVRGYDPRIYIRTGEFLQSISWGVTHGRVWAGIPAHAMHTGKLERADEPQRRPIPMRWLARWLEFGATQNRVSPKGNPYTIFLPPRPIWRPILSKFIRMKPKFAKGYRKAYNAAVRRRGKKLGLRYKQQGIK